MVQAIKAKDLPEAIAYKAKVAKARKSAKVKEQGKDDFSGKTFQNLNSAEKDELLKVLAISAGIIDE